MKHSTQTIAVVGASARAAAFSLLRAGYRVVAADLFADADLARACPATRIEDYPNGFERWLSETDCDGWLYTGALENHPKLVDRLAKIRPLIGHSGETLRRVRDPLALQRVLQENGFAFPVTRASSNFSPADGLWLAKSYEGSSVNTSDAFYWQQMVKGTSLSAVYRGAVLLGVTRQLVGERWANARAYQYCGTIAPWPLAAAKRSTLEKLGRLLRDEFGLHELYGVDLIDDGDQLWVIEVNPRYTAAVEVVERVSNAHVLGKVIVYASEPIMVSAPISTHLLQQAGTALSPTLADIPGADTTIETGQPILTLFADGQSCEAVEDRLRQQTRELEQLLYTKEVQPCD